MDSDQPPYFYLVNFLCSSFCIGSWLTFMMFVSRIAGRRLKIQLQEALQDWTRQQGYKVVRQKCPAWGNPMTWFVFAPDCPWKVDTTFGGSSYSTQLTLEDKAGRLRQGRLRCYWIFPWEYFGTLRVEWKEQGEPPPEPEPEPSPPDPREDPLWDRWTDEPVG